jgi:hypothetical protein
MLKKLKKNKNWIGISVLGLFVIMLISSFSPVMISGADYSTKLKNNSYTATEDADGWHDGFETFYFDSAGDHPRYWEDLGGTVTVVDDYDICKRAVKLSGSGAGIKRYLEYPIKIQRGNVFPSYQVYLDALLDVDSEYTYFKFNFNESICGQDYFKVGFKSNAISWDTPYESGSQSASPGSDIEEISIFTNKRELYIYVNGNPPDDYEYPKVCDDSDEYRQASEIDTIEISRSAAGDSYLGGINLRNPIKIASDLTEYREVGITQIQGKQLHQVDLFEKIDTTFTDYSSLLSTDASEENNYRNYYNIEPQVTADFKNPKRLVRLEDNETQQKKYKAFQFYFQDLNNLSNVDLEETYDAYINYTKEYSFESLSRGEFREAYNDYIVTGVAGGGSSEDYFTKINAGTDEDPDFAGDMLKVGSEESANYYNFTNDWNVGKGVLDSEGDLNETDDDYTILNSTSPSFFGRPGTYLSGDNEVGDTGTSIDFVTDTWMSDNTGVEIIEELNGHKRVMRLWDRRDSRSADMKAEFSDIGGDGNTIEFWIAFNESVDDMNFAFRDDYDTVIRLDFYRDTLQVTDRSQLSNMFDLYDIEPNIFTHIKIKTDLVNDRFDIYINDTLHKADCIPYYPGEFNDGIDGLRIWTGSSQEVEIYLNAFGMPDWDDSYSEGDNLEDGFPQLDTTLTNQVNISEGMQSKVKLTYSLKTDIRQKISFKIFNNDLNQFDLITESYFDSFSENTYSLNSSYFDENYEIKVKFEASNSTSDFQVYIDRLSLDYDGYMVQTEVFTHLGDLDYNPLISAEIDYEIRGPDNEWHTPDPPGDGLVELYNYTSGSWYTLYEASGEWHIYETIEGFGYYEDFINESYYIRERFTKIDDDDFTINVGLLNYESRMEINTTFVSESISEDAIDPTLLIDLETEDMNSLDFEFYIFNFTAGKYDSLQNFTATGYDDAVYNGEFNVTDYTNENGQSVINIYTYGSNDNLGYGIDEIGVDYQIWTEDIPYFNFSRAQNQTVLLNIDSFDSDNLLINQYQAGITFNNESGRILWDALYRDPDKPIWYPEPTNPVIHFSDYTNETINSLQLNFQVFIVEISGQVWIKIRVSICFNDNYDLVIQKDKMIDGGSGSFYCTQDYIKVRNIDYFSDTNDKMYTYNHLRGLRSLTTLNEEDINSFQEIGWFEQPITLYEPPTPPTPKPSPPDEPDAPTGHFWEYTSFRIIEDSKTEITFSEMVDFYNTSEEVETSVNYTYIKGEPYQAKFYYEPESVKSLEHDAWGDWGVNNWFRDLLVNLLNVLIWLLNGSILAFQFLFYCLVVAFNYLIMYLFVVLVIPFLWNTPIYWGFYMLVIVMHYLSVLGVYILGLMISFLTWLWLDIMIPLFEWLNNVFMPWFIELWINMVLLLPVMIITLLAGEPIGGEYFTEMMEMGQTLVYETANMLFSMIGLFIQYWAVFLGALLFYLLGIGLLLTKFWFFNMKGDVDKAESAMLSAKSFLRPFIIIMHIIQEIKNTTPQVAGTG